MKNRVLVLGGGVGGMTTAHELAERGFEVVVLERRKVAGGKARSIWVPDTGNRPLPGEHGFRFFPGFYRHVPETMQRIPFDGGTVADHLVVVNQEGGTRLGGPFFLAVPHFPTTWEQFLEVLQMPEDFYRMGVTQDDLQFFGGKLWRMMTSCQSRRLEEYGRTSWWSFVDAADRSEAYRLYLAIGPTRNLVATRAEIACARTVGDIAIQILLNQFIPGETADRVLDGPTNVVWIDPWKRHLAALGVDYREDVVVEGIDCVGGRVSGVRVRRGDGAQETLTADWYVSALPVEVMAKLLTPELRAADPVLAGLDVLRTQVNWMNGIQIYLLRDAPITSGHVNYLDSPWALTSISQQQFWPRFHLADRGDGRVHGCLSVDISDWDKVGLNKKSAKECSPEEIFEEVFAQLQASLNVDGVVRLRREDVHSWFLDPDIQHDDNPHKLVNLEPLLINQTNSWGLRPDAYLAIPNLFLASDYVRTNTDFASMEGANEAARRAVNALLLQAGSSARLCAVYPLHEPEILAPFRMLDRERYERGLPWANVFDRPRGWLEKLHSTVGRLLES